MHSSVLLLCCSQSVYGLNPTAGCTLRRLLDSVTYSPCALDPIHHARSLTSRGSLRALLTAGRSSWSTAKGTPDRLMRIPQSLASERGYRPNWLIYSTRGMYARDDSPP